MLYDTWIKADALSLRRQSQIFQPIFVGEGGAMIAVAPPQTGCLRIYSSQDGRQGPDPCHAPQWASRCSVLSEMCVLLVLMIDRHIQHISIRCGAGRSAAAS